MSELIFPGPHSSLHYKPNASAPTDVTTTIMAKVKLQSDTVAAPPVKDDGVGAPFGAVTEPLVPFSAARVAEAEALMTACADFVADAMAACTEALSEAFLT